MPARGWKKPLPGSGEIINVGIRLRKGLRQKVVTEARKNNVSISAEIGRRIEATFESGALRTIEDVATELTGAWASWKDQEREIRRMCGNWTKRREKADA